MDMLHSLAWEGPMLKRANPWTLERADRILEKNQGHLRFILHEPQVRTREKEEMI